MDRRAFIHPSRHSDSVRRMLRFTSSLAAGLLLSAALVTHGRGQPAEEKPAEAAEPAKPAEAAPPSPSPAAEPSRTPSGAGAAPPAAPSAAPTTPGAIPLPEIRVTIPDERPAAPKRVSKPRVAAPAGVPVWSEPRAPIRARTTAGVGQAVAPRQPARHAAAGPPAAAPVPAPASPPAGPAEPGAPNML